MRRLLGLLLLLLVTVSLSPSVRGAIPSVTFLGFPQGFDIAPGSNEYTDTDLFPQFKNAMPGDRLTQTIRFTNAAQDWDDITLCLRAEPHDGRENPPGPKVGEGETPASMEDFLSRLTMAVWREETLVFRGTPGRSSGSLGTFRRGESALLRVELTVPRELGNEFACRAGEVDWVFHAEGFSETQRSVRKVWSDGNENHTGDRVTVHLLRDGRVEEARVLEAENGWACTFDGLAPGSTWTVEEAEVPEGYAVGYETVGNVTTIFNTRTETPPDPGEPLDMEVRKLWQGDEGESRPSSVSVTLYNGAEAYDTVSLGEWNGWSHHWKDLSALGNWQIMETNIPRGYVPSYTRSGRVVTVTNTRSLIQTGQETRLIWLLGGVGLLLLLTGFLLRKRQSRG